MSTDIFIGHAKKFVDSICASETGESLEEKLILRKEFIDQFKKLLQSNSCHDCHDGHNDRNGHNDHNDQDKFREKISYIFCFGFFRDISHNIGNQVYYFITTYGSIYIIDKLWTYRNGYETLYEFLTIDGYSNIRVDFVFGEFNKTNISGSGYI
jgi:hypothetical protein